jgi:hypothetical protein
LAIASQTPTLIGCMLLTNLSTQLGVAALLCLLAAISEALNYDSF